MASCYSKWLRFCDRIHRIIATIFARWAYFVFHHPLIVIAFSSLVAFGLMTGFMRYSVYGQAEKLFYPQNSDIFQALDRVEGNFDYYIQNEEFILKSKKPNANILQDETFKLALDIDKDLEKIQGFRDFCVQSPTTTTTITGSSNVCTVLGPFELFQDMDFSNAPGRLYEIWIKNKRMMSNGLGPQRNFPLMFGEFSVNHTAGEISASVVRISYPVYFAKSRSDFERNSKYEKEMIMIFEKHKTKMMEKDVLELSYQTVRGLSDSIAQNTKDNMRLIVISIGSMIIFCVISMVNCKNKVRGHILISLVGILAVIFGIGAGFGFGLLIGQPYVGFVGVLPFLVLGIGIDDIFIILNALDRVDNKVQGAERMSEMLSKAGFSILMTTLTDIVAFIVGTVSVFPAIRIFCVFAFLSVLFAFLMIMTFFLAVLTYDIKRVEKKQFDCVPCIVSQEEGLTMETNEETQNSCSFKLLQGYGLFMMRPVVKGVVVCCTLLLMGFGIYGTIHTKLDFDYKISGAKTSPYIDWLLTMEERFPFGVFQFDLILDTPGLDYSNSDVQRSFLELDQAIQKVPELDHTKTINWMTAFVAFTNSSSTDNFIGNLNTFLNMSQDFRTDIKFNSHKDSIIASRIHVFTRKNPSYGFYKDAYVNLREEIEKANLDFYPVSFSLIYVSHLVVIVKATIGNIGICCAVILLLTLTFVKRPVVSFLLLYSFASFMLELLAVMLIWDLSLNSVTMIVMLMAIGFTVDYNCHIVHGYMSSRKSTPNERMVDSLTTLGFSVLKGGLSTLIGVLVLCVSSSKLFRLFFKMMFSIIILGLVHGVVILPVFLTLLVRTRDQPADQAQEIIRNGVERDSKKVLLKSADQNGASGSHTSF